MDKGATRLANAIEAGETIAIFGDYDVDGATSAALLTLLLRQLGAEPIVYIPDRLMEGYGPSGAALVELKARGASLAITVDCGAQAFEALAMARAAGVDVIVVDHHKCASRLPDGFAIVNPNRLDEGEEASGHGHLAAVGVAFLLGAALRDPDKRLARRPIAFHQPVRDIGLGIAAERSKKPDEQSRRGGAVDVIVAEDGDGFRRLDRVGKPLGRLVHVAEAGGVRHEAAKSRRPVPIELVADDSPGEEKLVDQVIRLEIVVARIRRAAPPAPGLAEDRPRYAADQGRRHQHSGQPSRSRPRRESAAEERCGKAFTISRCLAYRTALFGTRRRAGRERA